MLVQWVSYDMIDSPPHLTVRTVLTMSGYCGEEQEGGGWSYGSGTRVEDHFRQHPELQIWSVPAEGPPGLLLPLRGKPGWTPPPPKAPRRCTCQGQAPHAPQQNCKTADEEERDKRIAEARASGVALFECSECSVLLDELVPIRECPQCGDTKWNGTDGRNCPDCNRPFSRILTEEGCPECFAEDCEQIVEAAPAAVTPKPEPTKKRRKR